MAEPTSRLLTNTANYRDKLYARNLYTPDVEYPESNETTITKTVNAINTIIGGLTPFKSYNLENTVYGRIIANKTPLSTIGLAMLGKQLALNSMSNLVQKNFPIINPSNLFDQNSDTKLFTKKIDYNITPKSNGSTFNNFLNAVIYSYPNQDNPFSEKSTNDDYIKNTGSGQLKSLYTAINRNIYKPNNNSENSAFYQYADKTKMVIYTRTSLINIGSKVYFDYNNTKFNPYYPIPLFSNTINAIQKANQEMIGDSIDPIYKTIREYAPNIDFIIDNFGTQTSNRTIKESGLLGLNSDSSMNGWIDKNSEFNGDILTNRVVWGRDGTIAETKEYLAPLQGLSKEVSSKINISQDLPSNFNIRDGLLEYTRNLINSTEGRIGDITRKAFTSGGQLVGFNGSALWKAPSTALPAFSGKTGIRQHSVLDPYNRFAKAIRFDGNKVYGGNKDSVIYNTVMPRIHPTLKDDGTINNKNLMLSLENLAVRVISKDGVGIIDDEYGSQIPVCEVGPFNGRIMWFPPYALEVQETANAKYEPTVMVGRNEPMYNYQNSERTAVLNFTLLIDYPPQVRGFNNQKEMAEFFEFGGVTKSDPQYVDNLQLKINLLQLQIDEITESGKIIIPETKPPRTFNIYYPNDIPRPNDNLQIIIDTMYSGGYEILDNVISTSYDSGHYGYNSHVYYINGLSEYSDMGKTYYEFLTPPTFSQYTATGLTDQFGNESEFNTALKDMFDIEDTRKYYDVIITGSASKLYYDPKQEPTYNQKLGQRRADAAKVLVEKRLQTLYKKSAQELGITIKATQSIGSSQSGDAGAAAAAIPYSTTKQERSAEIKIIRNSTPFEPQKSKTTIEEQTEIDILRAQIEIMRSKIDDAKTMLNRGCIMNERREDDTAILHGFKSTIDNYYAPIFHSQTPEDFHKRLTFLQQCTRQGSAKRYSASVDDNGILRAKNSVFGRQPICILRIGDFYYTKVIIESINFDYSETTWDTNPEGFGMQPMICKVTLNMKVIGGQSLKGPIDALQNAVSFNYYANSNFTDKGLYKLPSRMSDNQESYINGVLTSEQNALTKVYDDRQAAAKAINSLFKIP